jgi:hypothetical protein
MPEQRFLVFSPTRCGSTTLRRLLNCHPQIRCLEEPFNPFNYEGRYLAEATDQSTLADVLRSIWRTHNGIKHTFSPDGWPFVNPSLNRALLLAPRQKVIYLRRRNLLRRLVSAQISTQTGVWGLFNETDRKRVRDFEFAPLNVEFVQSQLRRDSDSIAEYRRLLIQSGSEPFDLLYEDLYNPEKTPRELCELLNEVFRFVGVLPITDETLLASVERLFDQTRMKLNSVETYKRIPRIEALNAKCGSDETGWLFEQ